MDVVYVVRPGDYNRELQYSLRALSENLPHDKLWISGYMPTWIQGAHYIPGNGNETKYANSTGNIRAACEHLDVSDDFVWMNDDFFILNPMDRVPDFHRGPIRDVIEAYERKAITDSPYVQGMRATEQRLKGWGFDTPLSYELHIPMVVNKQKLLKTWEKAGPIADGLPVHTRTLYGNLWNVTGEKVNDVKIYHSDMEWSEEQDFISTSDTSFRWRVGRWIRDRFPDPSPYEKADILDGGLFIFTHTETGATRLAKPDGLLGRKLNRSPEWEITGVPDIT